jgi:hypothetical protein
VRWQESRASTLPEGSVALLQRDAEGWACEERGIIALGEKVGGEEEMGLETHGHSGERGAGGGGTNDLARGIDVECGFHKPRAVSIHTVS